MNRRAKRILVTDDEVQIQRVLRRILTMSGYEVFIAGNGEEAIEQVHRLKPDLILLDICMVNALDGLDVCIRIRDFTNTPIIILSALTDEKMKVKALDLGADDYLTKPWSHDELQARVRACLRRAVGEPGTARELASEDGHIHMDIPTRTVRVGKREIRLTPTEFSLLKQLMLSEGKVLTHRALLRAVWGPDYGDELEYLRVYMRHLRRKVEADHSHPEYILTEPGVGYVFANRRVG